MMILLQLYLLIIMCGYNSISFECLNSLEKSSDQGGVSSFRDRRFSEKILCPNCCLDHFTAYAKSLSGSPARWGHRGGWKRWGAPSWGLRDGVPRPNYFEKSSFQIPECVWGTLVKRLGKFRVLSLSSEVVHNMRIRMDLSDPGVVWYRREGAAKV